MKSLKEALISKDKRDWAKPLEPLYLVHALFAGSETVLIDNFSSLDKHDRTSDDLRFYVLTKPEYESIKNKLGKVVVLVTKEPIERKDMLNLIGKYRYRQILNLNILKRII